MLNDAALARSRDEQRARRATVRRAAGYVPSSWIPRSGTRRAPNGRRQVMRVFSRTAHAARRHVRFTSLEGYGHGPQQTRCFFAAACLGLAVVAAPVKAQYDCSVSIELDGKAVLAGRIRDEQRPSTEALWNLLKTLSFERTTVGKEVADPKSVDRTQLKGKIRVTIDGAGQAELAELNFVRNKYNPDAWVIAPTDVTRVIKSRQK
jgi:hypothetical protein